MSDTIDTVATVIEEAAPIAAAATSNPEVAMALKLAPVAIQMLQAAHEITQAGAMTPEQLAVLWNIIGQGIQNTHAAWQALNATKAF